MDNSFVIKGFSDNRSIWQHEYKFIVAAIAGSDERGSITTDSAAVSIYLELTWLHGSLPMFSSPLVIRGM